MTIFIKAKNEKSDGQTNTDRYREAVQKIYKKDIFFEQKFDYITSSKILKTEYLI